MITLKTLSLMSIIKSIWRLKLDSILLTAEHFFTLHPPSSFGPRPFAEN